jgi:hypothetical protein
LGELPDLDADGQRLDHLRRDDDRPDTILCHQELHQGFLWGQSTPHLVEVGLTEPEKGRIHAEGLPGVAVRHVVGAAGFFQLSEDQVRALSSRFAHLKNRAERSWSSTRFPQHRQPPLLDPLVQ